MNLDYSNETIVTDYKGKVLVNEHYFFVYVTIFTNKRNSYEDDLDLYVYEENEKQINENTIVDRIGMTYSELWDHVHAGILDGTYDDLEEMDVFH
jgi:hypothetical protein